MLLFLSHRRNSSEGFLVFSHLLISILLAVLTIGDRDLDHDHDLDHIFGDRDLIADHFFRTWSWSDLDHFFRWSRRVICRSFLGHFLKQIQGNFWQVLPNLFSFGQNLKKIQRNFGKWSENDQKIFWKWSENDLKVIGKWSENDRKVIGKWSKVISDLIKIIFCESDRWSDRDHFFWKWSVIGSRSPKKVIVANTVYLIGHYLSNSFKHH